MIKRTVFQGLAVLAVVAIALAIWLSDQWQPGSDRHETERGKLLPSLSENLNAVTRLAISQGDARLELKRQDEQWGSRAAR